MSRADYILGLFDHTGFGLEVGPSYNPLLPKSEGFNVETIDYANQATLIEKYSDNPNVDVSRIEHVDYVSDGRSLSDVIGGLGRYDFIVASHVIEHTPDLLGFLKDCECLLKSNGTLVLALPDKRCCFDIYQRLSSIGEIIDAHRSGRTRPTFGNIFDAVACGVKRNGQTGWPLNATGDLALAHSFDQALATAQDSEKNDRYTDVHVWRFVPSSFALTIATLKRLGFTDFAATTMRAQDEIVAVLQRGASASEVDELALLEQIAHESAIQISDQAAKKLQAERTRLDNIERTKLEAVEDKLREADRTISLMRASKSWRWTSLLRRVRSLKGSL